MVPKTKFRTYEIVGRKSPKGEEETDICKMTIFAENEVFAQSKYWYYMRDLKKVKRVNGEILSCREIYEKHCDTVKNFAIWLRYNSRSGTHNMYREYRDVCLNGAVDQMYQDMGGRHRARFQSIQIIDTAVIPYSKCRRDQTLQYQKKGIKFPVVHKVYRPATLQHKTVFKASRPSTGL